jgi:tetratricopeptide (TPR) repeat protein
MGARYEQEGDVDSMVVCYDKALQIAKRSRIPGQTARIYSFYAGHYYREGRLALAHAMYQQAIDWCREFKGGEMEVRYILAAMTYYERLGCWDICEQNLARARLLEKRYGDELLDVQKLRLDRFDARIAMARGRVDQADAAYRRIKQPVDDLRYREDMIEMLFNWGQGLVDNHRPAAALPIIEEGWIRSQSEFVPDWTPRFALLKAEAQIDLGTLDNARVSIAGFDSLSANGNRRYTREWIRRDALLARLEYAAGHREAALGQVETGFVRLREAIGDLDPSVHSYLWIGEGEGLRDVVHDLVADDPALGYGAEMMWRCFYRDLGQRLASADSGDEAVRCAPKASSGSLKTDLAAASDQAVKRVTSREAIHCVYRVQRDEIWRWTVSGDGIRRDVIQITPSALADLVSSTYDGLSRDPKTPKLNSPLRRDLRRLGLLLLPDEVLAAVDTASKPLLLVTTDGFLGRMPFEAFDTAAKGGYAPLLLTHDVAYVRFTDPATEAPPVSNGVIVVNPRPSQEQLKRFPFRQELEQAEKEGRAMAEVDPAAKYFGGRTATKSRLKKSCRDASYFYFAVHTLRDPAVPYLVLIPLAADSLDTGPDAEYLDILDIRNCDLSRCRVAILSGCSSGAPYVALAGSGPSLGDAFLDSGSGAVIQTFWDVDDNDARNLMTAFVRLWKGTCLTEVKTLSEARRRAMMSSDGVRHPSSWASYSIKLSKL